MRSYAISGFRCTGAAGGVAEFLLHRCTRNVESGLVQLQPGVGTRPAEVAALIARGDRVFTVRMSSRRDEYEAADSIRFRPAPTGYLGSTGKDGDESNALAALPRY